jgi:hypothetical protein
VDLSRLDANLLLPAHTLGFSLAASHTTNNSEHNYAHSQAAQASTPLVATRNATEAGGDLEKNCGLDAEGGVVYAPPRIKPISTREYGKKK